MSNRTLFHVACGLLGLLMAGAGRAEVRVLEAVDVGPVWSAHPVGFDLLTHGKRQYVAYYDDQRQMTIASRQPGEKDWTKKVLPTNVVWDSHNYVTMAIDGTGHLHVSGNMHCVPLIYFRTTRAGDVQSLEQVKSMVGTEEGRCTYPHFFRGPNEQLIFTYRDGRSGSGNQIYNVYDESSRTWRRLLDRPLTDGRGKMNAYLHGPKRGPDGWFHLCWVWRNSPDCATNHTVSYARSRDLVRWETAGGKPLALPLTVENADVVDPIPPGGGIVNGNAVLGFDAEKRIIISYHKYDSAGKTQIYNARFEDGAWKIRQASDWDYRWEFSGGGTIVFEVHVGAVTVEPDGALSQSWSQSKLGSGVWRLDPATLRPAGKIEPQATRPRELMKLESEFPGMQVKWKESAGDKEAAERYVLRWETLPANRDRPRPAPLPAPSMLRVYRIGM